MRKIELSPKEKFDLELRHKQSKDVNECYRINAVLLRSEGWTLHQIAKALLVHTSTIARHLDDYESGKLAKHSGGSSSFLFDSQTMELIEHLDAKIHHTTQSIVTHVYETYGVLFSIPGMNKWLHRNGFTYKKPKGWPHKGCPKEQKKFEQKYNSLKDKLAEDDGIMFMDACHPSMATKTSCGWIKTGKSKLIETTANKTRMNIVGAIDLNNLSKPVVSSYSTVDKDVIMDFLSQLREHAGIPGTIHLILDRASYQDNDMVRAEAEKLRIKLHHLPPYSPNLNPMERL
jgi:transposase